MQITLKNFKHSEFASEETYCFQADVWIDGVKMGQARNDGHGGCNDIHPQALYNKLEEYAKTLPPHESEYGKLAYDADLLISEAVTDMLFQKDVKKLLSNKIAFTVKGEKGIYTVKYTSASAKNERLKDMTEFNKKFNTDVVLNTLSIEDAVKIYKENA